jgi:hypothetical protein
LEWASREGEWLEQTDSSAAKQQKTDLESGAS